MTRCDAQPPCNCEWHRAQIIAFAAWQEEINEGVQ